MTALHNHLLRNEPFTMYMHVPGHGDTVELAAALHGALAESKAALENSGAAPALLRATRPSTLTPIDTVLSLTKAR